MTFSYLAFLEPTGENNNLPYPEGMCFATLATTLMNNISIE